jgi:hypothetical protein
MRRGPLYFMLLVAGCGGRPAVPDAGTDRPPTPPPDHAIADHALADHHLVDARPADARPLDRTPDQYVTPPPAWALSAGGTGTDAVEAMALDSTGNVYLTGYFSGKATFGATTLTATSSSDLFVAKILPSGTFAWAVSGHGTGFNRGTALAIAPGGDVVVAGEVNGTITFGATTLSSTGGGDVFVARLDSSGALKWAVAAGGTGWDFATAVVVDAAGVYVTGSFFDIATFGGHTASAPGKQGLFVARASHAGAFQSAVAGVPTAWVAPNAITVDSTGDLRLAGSFRDTLKLGSKTLTSAGEEDLFVARLESDGTWLWAISAGGVLKDTVGGLALDAAGNAYLTGAFQGAATFGTHSLASPLETPYIAKASPAGTFDWAATALNLPQYLGAGSAIAIAAGDPIIVGMSSGSTTANVFLKHASPAGAILSTLEVASVFVTPLAIATDGLHAYIAANFSYSTTLSVPAVTLTSVGETDLCVWKMPLL